MGELVNKQDIQNYAAKNTSSKMPIEKKYLEAFVDSLLNSSSVESAVNDTKDIMQNGDGFCIFNSYWSTAKEINKEPFRSIVAYAMLKKDIVLFELISASLFTGYVQEYHGSDLYLDAATNTDVLPTIYTDKGLYTDMTEGMVQIGFHNIYATSYLEDGTGTEYQTLEELNEAQLIFEKLITITKPARVLVISLFEPYCFLGGDKLVCNSINIDTSDEYFMSPFGPTKEGGENTSIEILLNMSDVDVLDCYRVVNMQNKTTKVSRAIEVQRTAAYTSDKKYIVFTYEMRTMASAVSDNIWDTITITSNTSNKTFIPEKKYDATLSEHYERYIPIMLRIKDDPDAPVLAFNVTDDIGAMLYIREKKSKE